ncbi:MAG: hypothetical protein A3K77_00640 [Euryarchaeota archaeon RBG_13_31_8]|nr:MAG: hypothetical protein A3K77_00640 [Euryarchaeota archaeon RBG_13_31_8]
MVLDIMRLSASRHELLYRSTESLKNNLQFNGKIRIIFHEDVLNEAASNKCIQIAQENNFDIIKSDKPNIGHGASLNWLLKQVTSKYVLNWEDDQELIRDLDLDRIIFIMDKHPDKINQVAFHKREIEKHHYDWVAEEIELENTKFVTNPHWAYVPALWRAEYIKPRWLGSNSGNHHWEQNAHLKKVHIDSGEMKSAKWVLENTKTFYFGKVGEPAYVKHIGTANSLRTGEYKWMT